MSFELLAALREMHAFDPTPGLQQLGRTHVPFDLLLHSAEYEAALQAAVSRGERIALVGASGSGKTSITSHVFNQRGVPRAAPIDVRVTLDGPEIAQDPASFARHIVRTVDRYLKATGASGDDAARARQAAETAAVGEQHRPLIQVGLTGGLPWLSAHVATELRGAITLDPTGQDIVEQAQLVLNIIATHRLLPVLIFEDTDHWLVRPGLPDPEPSLAGFFGPVMRLLAEDLPMAAAVVAVHETYLAHPSYQEARGLLETPVVVPRLAGPDNIATILARRAVVTLGQPVEPGDFLDSTVVDRLWELYLGEPNLRSLMTTVHQGLSQGCDAGASLITAAHVDAVD